MDGEHPDPHRLPSGTFMGRTGRDLIGAAGRVTEVRHEAHAAYPAHGHLSPQLCFVLEGRFSERDSSGERECGAGAIVFSPPTSRHAETFGATGARCLGIELAGGHEDGTHRVRDARAAGGAEQTGGAGPEGGQEPTGRLLRHGRLLGLIARLYGRLDRSLGTCDMESPGVEALMRELAVEVQRHLASGSGGGEPAWVASVDEALEREPAYPPPLTELAREVGLHPVHVSQSYARFRGSTIRESIRQRRIGIAAHLIMTGDIDLAAVARRAGFADQSHLTRVFGSVVGLTPGRFRKLLHG